MYEAAADPRTSFANTNFKGNHRWIMFLSLNNDTYLTSKYIQKVVYHLHPIYKACRIEVSEPPFILARSAYVPFIMGIEIFFHTTTRLKPIRLDHIPLFETFGQITARKINLEKLSESIDF